MSLLIFVLLILLALRDLCSTRPKSKKFCRREKATKRSHSSRRKPDWVRRTVLLMYEQSGLRHRKLAEAFNQRYQASTGITVGRTYVREQILRRQHRELHIQRALKHIKPIDPPVGTVWGMDGTHIADAGGVVHTVFGIIDHGSRMVVSLRPLRRFNTWTLLGTVFLAIGEFGKPGLIKLDNHPVHHAWRFKHIMRMIGVRLRFSPPACPWKNGRIERFFGTLKERLGDLVPLNRHGLQAAMREYRFFHNSVRPHQHLDGCTPEQVWHGIDPYRCKPRSVQTFIAWQGRLRGWVLRY